MNDRSHRTLKCILSRLGNALDMICINDQQRDQGYPCDPYAFLMTMSFEPLNVASNSFCFLIRLVRDPSLVSHTLFNLVHNKFCFLISVILHPRDLVTCCNIYRCNLTKPAVCIFTRHVGEQIPVLQSHVIYCSFGIPNVHLYGHRITR